MTSRGGVAERHVVLLRRAGMVQATTLGLPLLLAFNVATLWPLLTGSDQWLAATTMLVSASFFVTGALVATDAGHRATAIGLWLAAILWPLNWLNEWQVGAFPLLAALEGPLASLVGVWAIMRYPEAWAGRRQESAVISMLIGVQCIGCLTVLTSLPQWQGLPVGDPWLALWPDREAYRVACLIYGAGGAVAAVAVATTIVVRLLKLTGPDRRAMRPVVVAVPVAAGFSAASAVGAQTASSIVLRHHLDSFENVALAGVPAAFMLAALRRWLARESAHALIRRLGVAPTPEQIESAIRELLGEPSLILIYRAPRGHVDVFGRTLIPPPVGDPRLIATVPIGNEPDGVLIVGNPALRRHPHVIASVIRVAALALENTQLQALQRAQIAQLALSADRLRHSVEVEQRRIQNAVATIVQDRLSTVREHLAALNKIHPPTSDVTKLAKVTEILDFALDNLRTLAAGTYPAELSSHGLSTAVATATAQAGNLVVVSIPPRRFDTAVERAAYFAICELVANADKHAQGTRTIIRGSISQDTLQIEVSDDGLGGADPAGSGLAGLGRRLETVGGSLTILSPCGHGTHATIRMPAEPMSI